MALNTLAQIMQTGVNNHATSIANTLARGKSREECITALKSAFPNGAAFGVHKVVVAGQNKDIKLRVSVPGQTQYLIEFKIWMAADILELVQQGKLTNNKPPHGIYGAYKADYDKLVAARNQEWTEGNVPFMANCTLIYFLNPAHGAGDVQPYPDQVNAGTLWAQNNQALCQVSAASERLLGMIADKRRDGNLLGVQPTSIVTRLMTTTATHYPPVQHNEENNIELPPNERHTITLAAVWTEILPPTPN